ncbi:UbiH/UbiF family hydroxylase [Oryzifoliimicrobium ureilyticus]|uniref:UbiH/UbiF family hydroxylase n=1 Tax=Oryzifoliimicrobium ureilyticus TaxID=3113724 RepID=UPI003076769B
MDHFEVAVVGGGLAGHIAAISLARGGRSVALIAPTAPVPDRRTTALMDQSVRFLDRLSLWKDLRPSTAPLAAMRIIDGTDRLLRAPTTVFRSAEVGLEAFGYNFPNAVLLDQIRLAVTGEGRVSYFDTSLDTVVLDESRATLLLASGTTVTADFVVGADGRKSKLREAALIDVRSWSYPQSGLVLNFSHKRPHENISTEFHTEYGPFTQVPLPGNRSSLVWVQKPADAEPRSKLSLAELSALVEERMHSILGAVEVEETPQIWPLSGMVAHRFGQGRMALIGEAAHVFPPIGAQGLNLGLRDIMSLSSVLCEDIEKPIAADAGSRFDRKRRADVLSRTASVDLLNRSLLTDFLPVQMARAAGLQLLSVFPPLRSMVMREGVEPGRGLRAIPEAFRDRIMRKKA